MKCKYCHEVFPDSQVRNGRCPYCGGSVTVKPQKSLPVLVWIFIGAFLFVGVMMFLGGFSSWWTYQSYSEYYATVDACIVEIQKEVTYDRVNDETDVDYTVFVDYEYGGVEYERIELGYHNTTMREGDVLQIEIDTREPGVVVENVWWLMIVGLVIGGIGGTMLYFLYIKPRRDCVCEDG